MTDLWWMLALIFAIFCSGILVGWRAAVGFRLAADSALEAAKAVQAISAAAGSQAFQHAAALDKVAAEAASLRHSIEVQGKMTGVKLGDVETAISQLFQGFERAGIVRSAPRAPGRQVGEAPPE